MPVWVEHRLIAATADQQTALRVANSMGHVRPWLFVIGEGFSTDPDRTTMIAAAMRAMAEADLKVVRVGEAELPLGFRDIAVAETTFETLKQPPSPPIAGKYAGVVDMYSSVGNEMPGLRLGETLLEVDLAPRSRRRPAASLIFLAMAALLVGAAALAFSFLAKAPSSTPDGAPGASSLGGFAGGVLATLLIMAFGALALRAIRRHGSSTGRPAYAINEMAASNSGVSGAAGIFISYSHRDSRIAHDLADEVTRQGRPAWIFEQQMHGGRTGWAGQVVKALRESQAVMLIGSSSAFESDQVMREMYLAMDMKKPIVPMIVDDAPMPDDFQYILAQYQRHPVQPPLDLLVTRALTDC